MIESYKVCMNYIDVMIDHWWVLLCFTL